MSSSEGGDFTREPLFPFLATAVDGEVLLSMLGVRDLDTAVSGLSFASANNNFSAMVDSLLGKTSLRFGEDLPSAFGEA